MFSKTEQEQIEKETEADLNFQERLGDHSKQALIMLVDQLTSINRDQRGWVLKYLRGLEDMVDLAKLEPLQERVLDAIANERLSRDAQRGPVAMRPRTIDEWTTELSYAVTTANTKAAFGQTPEALKAILLVATICVEALEDRIDAEAAKGKDILAEAIKQLMEGPEHVVTLPGKGVKNKTADAAGTAPAAKSESLNNQ